jgi:LPXTG-motif cell wall-anchored protein
MLKSKSVVNFSKFLSFLISLISIGIFTNPIAANAEKGYRYWGYFQAAAGATSWTAAMTGPSVEVKDGDVEGWAFVFSSNDIPAVDPMMDPDFTTLCGDTPQAAGKVRVGLVVDFGAANIAPSGETPREFFSDCVVVDEGSVGLDVLQSAMAVNAGDSGLICGIAGYPASECGAEIDAPTSEEAAVVTTTSEEIAESNGSPILLGALGVLLISGFVLARRRNKR